MLCAAASPSIAPTHASLTTPVSFASPILDYRAAACDELPAEVDGPIPNDARSDRYSVPHLSNVLIVSFATTDSQANHLVSILSPTVKAKRPTEETEKHSLENES